MLQKITAAHFSKHCKKTEKLLFAYYLLFSILSFVYCQYSYCLRLSEFRHRTYVHCYFIYVGEFIIFFVSWFKELWPDHYVLESTFIFSPTIHNMLNRIHYIHIFFLSTSPFFCWSKHYHPIHFSFDWILCKYCRYSMVFGSDDFVFMRFEMLKIGSEASSSKGV